MTNSELVEAVIQAKQSKNWELYAELKKEFFSRVTRELAAYAEREARLAGLGSF